jgi:hypothetical protein
MRAKLLILILALQSAWVVGTAFTQERVLRVGKAILLETQPVDPRDLLSGDFIQLNYKISNVPTKLFSPPIGGNLPTGSIVFVALTRHGQFYEIARASADEFDPASGEILLRGRVGSGRWQPSGSIHLEYGLERFYVPEGKGNPRGKLTVQAVVPSSGDAAIKEVFIDGKPFADAMK